MRGSAPARRLSRIGAVLLAAFAGAPAARAEVGAVVIDRREDVLDGAAFGDAGAYERIVGTIEIVLDPALEANRAIVDLDRAPRDDRGLVRATADLYVLQPKDPERRRGTALLEVSNRGGKAVLPYFADARSSADPTGPEHFGDGLPLRLGLTLVWVGWQWDVPDGGGRLRLRAPFVDGVEGLVRSDWTVDAPAPSLPLGHRGHIAYAPIDESSSEDVLTVRDGRLAVRRVVPRGEWRFVRARDGDAAASAIERDGGFEAGSIYELVYRSRRPAVAGVGLAAIRDVASFLKHGEGCPFPARRVVAFGVSQTGRFLRHLLHQGFDLDERGRLALDACLVHTAGAGRGSFNHRFAQPSRDAHRYSAFFFPTDLFPFGTRAQRDPLTGAREGLRPARADGAPRPRVVFTNTGYEYWGRAASLLHTSLDGSADVEPFADERIYHLAGGQHFVAGFPPSPRARIEGAEAWSGDPLDFLVTLRALLVALVEWVETGREPPPSAYPRIDAGSLVPVSELRFPSIAGIEAPRVAHEAYRVDYGPEWPRGIVAKEPPDLGAAFPSLVPQVDALGNEIGGLRSLELAVPVATYAPWSVRRGMAGGNGELADFVGTIVPLAANSEARRQRSDPRPSLEELHGSRAVHLEHAARAADDLVRERLLLPEDRARVLRRAAELWDWAVSR